MESERRDLKPEYDIESAAEWLKISVRKMRQLVEDRKIGFLKIGAEIRFRQVDLDQFVSGCIRPQRPEHQINLPLG
jgi:excisionase family DNA binding protein